ncbi:uncharacterized protein FYW49_016980 [Xenentodon cancila]
MAKFDKMDKTLRELLCSSKMAEHSQQRKDDLLPPPAESHQSGLKEISGAHSQQLPPSQLSKEMLHQQRQKCELRRLLKHTHPELKMLGDVLDEEFADVLSSEMMTAGETGYEGEVLSRCMIFENPGLSNNTPKIHTAKGAVGRSDLSKPSSVSEGPKEGSFTESVKGIIKDDKSIDLQPVLKRDSEEEMKRIDVQATKMVFENQSFNIGKQDSVKFQGNVYMSKNDAKVLQNQKEPSHMETQHKSNECKSVNTVSCVNAFGQKTELDFCEKGPRDETLFEQEFTSFSESESHSETIKTKATLCQNNPFISTNVEKEHSYGHKSKTQHQNSVVDENYLTANVKKRTHLFESMPFDKIRHQNKDEIETLVENIKETLNSLYCVKVIHSAGAIIEVNETMIAKKAKFKISDNGPELNYDEVAEGGAQNFILQLLPRVNLKTPITYLKEDSKGCMGATVVDVPGCQHQPNTNKDTEFKTAKVVQLVEDILNQDNSLRKGLIIQGDVKNCAEVIVYSLYKYFNEEDVKSYSPPHKADETDMQSWEKRAINSPQETSQDQTRPGSIGPDEKGNVKLFKSCIEKGDLEYLKSLQAESPAQENILPPLLHEHLADESSTEWVPVDVKKLKSMFSRDKSHTQEGRIQSTTMCKSQKSGEHSIAHQQLQNTLRDCGAQAQEEVCNFKVVPSFKTKDNGGVQQAEPVKVTDGINEIFDPHTASHHLQEATIKEQSLQETQKISTQECSGKPTVSFTADNMQHSKTEALQESVNQKVEPCTELGWNEHSSASNGTTENKSDWQNKNTETYQQDDNTAIADTCSKEGQQATEMNEKVDIETYTASPQSSETSPAQEDEEEVVFQGKIQAALQSLERSNVNVSRGDFRAAMIYRNSYKPQQERSGNVHVASVQKANTEGFCPVIQPESAQVVPSQKATEETSKLPHQTESTSNPAAGVVLSKRKRCIGPKPAIPPKPEHLRAKQQVSQPTATKNLNTTQTNKQRTKETVPEFPQPSAVASISCKGECKQDQFKSNESVDHQRKDLLDKAVEELKETEVEGVAINIESNQSDESIINRQQEINAIEKDKNHQNNPGKDNKNEIEENHVDFHEACQRFGGR